MPKIEPKHDAANQAAAEPAATVAQELPRLGSIADVKVAVGTKLVNNETGQFFAEDTATPVTVTITTLRRLADGDLTLA